MELEIIQIIQELSTEGGAERVAWELARSFSRAGVKNKAITSTLGEPVGGDTKIVRTASWLSRIPTRGPLGISDAPSSFRCSRSRRRSRHGAILTQWCSVMATV